MIETHFEVDITTIEVDNQMAFIQVQVRNNIVENVFLNRGTSVNIIIENFITNLGLPKPKLV